MKKIILALIILIPLFFSCSTDFNVNATWKDITVVYFILNQNDSVQYAKVNKAFLGNENAYTMAKITDSVYYKNLSVQLIPFTLASGGADTTWYTSIPMTGTYEVPKDTIRLSGEPAIFSSDSNLLYKTTAKLRGDRYYKLKINIPSKHKTVTSTSNIINQLNVIKPTNIAQQEIGFAGDYGYSDFTAQWNAVPNASLYGVTLRFNYSEKYSNGSIAYKHIDMNNGNVSYTMTDTLSAHLLSSTFSGEAFFSYLGALIPVLSDSLHLIRLCTGIDFIFVVAGDALSTYIDVNGASNSIVQEHPLFTNINNGIGVFSTRYTKTVLNKQLSDRSVDELNSGKYTKNLRFHNTY